MVKFTDSEKIEMIKLYLDGNEGYKSLAEKLGVEEKTYHYWIKRYEYHGENAFTKTYTSYTTQFKLDVLNYMNDQGTSIRETAAIFNLSTPVVLLNWQKEMLVGGVNALEPKKKGRPPMTKDKLPKSVKQTPAVGSVEALQAELERLRMENAYLKKLNALVQNKEKSPNKTKHR